jgi:predicted MFS family arabinose efflux permease
LSRHAARVRLVTPTFVVVTASALAYFVGIGMLLPTIPRFVEDVLGGGGVAVGMVAGAFAFTAAVLRPWAGRIGDRAGRRSLVLGGSAILAGSYVLYVFADALLPLMLLRVVSGVGEAAMFVGAATAVQDLAPVERSGEAASYFSVAVYGGLGGGPPLGEAIQRAHGYDAVWVVAAAVTLLATVLGWWTPRGVATEPATSNGGAETRTTERRPLLNPAGLGPGSVLALSLSGLAAFTGFIALYVDHEDLGDAGPVFVLYGALILTMRLAGARAADRFGARQTATFAIGCIVSGMLVMAAWPARPGLYLATSVFAVGMALQYPALIRIVIERTAPGERSSAIATFSIFFDLSQGIGLFVLGAVVALGGERAAFLAAALLSSTAVVVLLRVTARPAAAGGRSAAAPAAPPHG